MHGGVKGFECKLLKREIINKQVFLGFVTHTQKKTNKTKKFLHVYFHKGHIILEEYFIPRSQWISFFAYLTNLLPTYKKNNPVYPVSALPSLPSLFQSRKSSRPYSLSFPFLYERTISSPLYFPLKRSRSKISTPFTIA